MAGRGREGKTRGEEVLYNWEKGQRGSEMLYGVG